MHCMVAHDILRLWASICSEGRQSQVVLEGFTRLQLLWRYSQEAVQLRIRYLTHVKKGGESHSIVTLDIPGECA